MKRTQLGDPVGASKVALQWRPVVLINQFAADLPLASRYWPTSPINTACSLSLAHCFMQIKSFTRQSVAYSLRIEYLRIICVSVCERSIREAERQCNKAIKLPTCLQINCNRDEMWGRKANSAMAWHGSFASRTVAARARCESERALGSSDTRHT